MERSEALTAASNPDTWTDCTRSTGIKAYPVFGHLGVANGQPVFDNPHASSHAEFNPGNRRITAFSNSTITNTATPKNRIRAQSSQPIAVVPNRAFITGA